MSIILTGNAANVTTPLSATVTALANNGSGAIRVTTSGSHLFGNNDQVLMAASPAIGLFKITAIDATHFDLQGSTFTTTGTGTATDQSLTPQIQIPTDGDTFSLQLSGMLSALQGTLDRTQYIQARTGAYKLVELLVFPLSGLVTDIQWSVTTSAPDTWTLAGSGGAVATIGDVQVGDIVELSFDSIWMAINAAAYWGVSLATSGYAPGVSPPTATRLPGSGKVAGIAGISLPVEVPVSISGAKTVAVTGNLDVWLMGITGLAATIQIGKESTLIAKVWRPTT